MLFRHRVSIFECIWPASPVHDHWKTAQGNHRQHNGESRILLLGIHLFLPGLGNLLKTLGAGHGPAHRCYKPLIRSCGAEPCSAHSRVRRLFQQASSLVLVLSSLKGRAHETPVRLIAGKQTRKQTAAEMGCDCCNLLQVVGPARNLGSAASCSKRRKSLASRSSQFKASFSSRR